MAPAPRFLRLWGIRHLRAAILTIKIDVHYDRMARAGFVPAWSQHEVDIVTGIRKGEL